MPDKLLTLYESVLQKTASKYLDIAVPDLGVAMRWLNRRLLLLLKAFPKTPRKIGFRLDCFVLVISEEPELLRDSCKLKRILDMRYEGCWP